LSLVTVVSIYWAEADHRDSPGLVLTCVCDAELARGWAQGYPNDSGRSSRQGITLLRVKRP